MTGELQPEASRTGTLTAYAVAFAITSGLIAAGSILLPKNSELAVFLFDRSKE